MSEALKRIKRAFKIVPPRILIYGPVKIGKTPACAALPDTIVIPAEADRLSHIDADTFPDSKTFEDICNAVDTLITEDHGYKVVLLDGADSVEHMIQKHVCLQNGWATIDSKDFNKDGHRQVANLWKELLEGFDILRNEKGMLVIFTCKVTHRSVGEVFGKAYTQYMPTLSEGSAGMKDYNSMKVLCDWFDIIGMVRLNIDTEEVKGASGKKDIKAVVQKGDCEVKLHLQRHPSYIGGNSYGLLDLPFDNPFDWTPILEATKFKI